MKAAEIRKLSDEDIVKKVNELREEYGNLSFQHKIRPLEDTSRLRKIKKDIARIETIHQQNINKTSIKHQEKRGQVLLSATGWRRV